MILSALAALGLYGLYRALAALALCEPNGLYAALAPKRSVSRFHTRYNVASG